jgi:hypothetical protein
MVSKCKSKTMKVSYYLMRSLAELEINLDSLIHNIMELVADGWDG